MVQSAQNGVTMIWPLARTARGIGDCLDRIVVFGEPHLRNLLRSYRIEPISSHRHKRPPPSRASATGLRGRGRRRDDDHDGDHDQEGISSEADV